MRQAVLDNLHTRETNPLANGPPVLWIHGLGESGLAFERAIEHGALESWRQLAPDLLGYGKSTWTEAPTSIPQHADRLVAWMTALNLPRTILVGHSMGGVIGQLVAERIPSRIAAFINVEGNICMADCKYSRRTTTYVLDDFLERGMTELLDDVYVQGEKSDVHRSYFASMRLCDPRAFHLNGRELVNLSRTGELAQRMGALNMPTRYIAGVPDGAGLDTHRALRSAGVTIDDVDRAGHWPFLDQTKRFATTLADFLIDNKLASQ